MTATMHEMIPKMIDSCFTKMTIEQRKAILSVRGTMLDEIERAHT